MNKKIAILSFAVAAWAQTGPCPPSPDLGASVTASVQTVFDAGTSRYTYSYVFTNNGSKDIAGVYIYVSPQGQPAQIRWPAGWGGGLFAGDERYVSWHASAAPRAGNDTSGAFVPPPARLLPGRSLGGFSFTSPLPPGDTGLLIEAVSPPLDADGQPIAADTEEGVAALQEEAGEILAERGCDVRTVSQAVASQVRGPVAYIPVTIRIKPNAPPPVPVNPSGNGTVPVAILSTASFDAGLVDPKTVVFGPGLAPALRSSLEDVDGDGRTDLVLHFASQSTGVRCLDLSAALKGKTYDGRDVQGLEPIRTVGCH